MAGKLCTGAATNNAALLHQSKAYCEGMFFRSQGTAVAYPITGNPHDGDSSEAETAWDAGWTAADGVAGGSITAAVSGCCGLIGKSVSA